MGPGPKEAATAIGERSERNGVQNGVCLQRQNTKSTATDTYITFARSTSEGLATKGRQNDDGQPQEESEAEIWQLEIHRPLV
ncbi:hypothetical protein Y1Q_0013690 [Alligator mississippiensis]|uniref:Uncharacterized protein n=1 Tax=Alligator mississippiensis TaxID=8496 RepID=A0A151P3R2_ALLMI|nr:hypothetical protein Y1Q_0013690 [Alligator mississippiensis]